MKRKWLLILSVSIVAALLITGSVFAKAYRGTDYYDGLPQLGLVTWLDNPAGFHFWFTMEADHGVYDEGHSYHNIYKLMDKVDDPSEWCGPVTIPNKSPFNQTRHVGEQTYYKIWDVTAEMWVCP